MYSIHKAMIFILIFTLSLSLGLFEPAFIFTCGLLALLWIIHVRHTLTISKTATSEGPNMAGFGTLEDFIWSK